MLIAADSKLGLYGSLLGFVCARIGCKVGSVACDALHLDILGISHSLALDLGVGDGDRGDEDNSVEARLFHHRFRSVHA